MWFDVFVAVSTGLFTVLVGLFTRQATHALRDAQAIARTLRKYAVQHELIIEELDAVKKRQHKLAGRFYREKRGAGDDDSRLVPDPDAPSRDGRTHDFVNGVDDELAALLEMQAGSSPVQK